MKSHIFCAYGDKIKKKSLPQTFYDFRSQISYFDQLLGDKVIDHFMHDTTVETSTIENTDQDNCYGKGPKTVITETVEISDPDNFSVFSLGTIETRATETSDSDHYRDVAATTSETFTVENTDRDELFPSFV